MPSRHQSCAEQQQRIGGSGSGRAKAEDQMGKYSEQNQATILAFDLHACVRASPRSVSCCII